MRDPGNLGCASFIFFVRKATYVSAEKLADLADDRVNKVKANCSLAT
jgi:hypothetical protein